MILGVGIKRRFWSLDFQSRQVTLREVLKIKYSHVKNR